MQVNFGAITPVLQRGEHHSAVRERGIALTNQMPQSGKQSKNGEPTPSAVLLSTETLRLPRDVEKKAPFVVLTGAEMDMYLTSTALDQPTDRNAALELIKEDVTVAIRNAREEEPALAGLNCFA